MALRHWMLAALAAGCVASVRSSRKRRLQGRPNAQPRPLQTWEGEGGGVPVGGGETAASRVHHVDPLPRGMP